jgi:serine protease Do
VTDINDAKKVQKPAASKEHAKYLLLILAAIAAGFLGGRFSYATRSTISATDTVVQREVINSESELINKIATSVGESVVSINVVSTSVVGGFFGAQEIEQESAGTGFILSKDGIIVTNRHVVSQTGSEVSVTLSDGTELEDVEIIGKTNPNDPLDIAFLKIQDTQDKDLKPVTLGDSGTTKVGDKVVAIGNALGQFQNTVTSGIISGYGRDIVAGDSSGANKEPLQNLLQTDAAINSGNSGGPLVNAAGEVIGVNVAVAGFAENIGFAIPINDIKGLVASVFEKGKLERAYIGIRYLTVNDDVANEYNLSVKRGIYIPVSGRNTQQSILPDGPGAKAGLREGDVITEVDGEAIDEKNSLVSILGRKRVGQVVELKIIRDGNEQNISVTLEATPQS